MEYVALISWLVLGVIASVIAKRCFGVNILLAIGIGILGLVATGVCSALLLPDAAEALLGIIVVGFSGLMVSAAFFIFGLCQAMGITDQDRQRPLGDEKLEELKAEYEELKADIKAKELTDKPVSRREYEDLKAECEELKAFYTETKQLRDEPSRREDEELKAHLTRVYEQLETKHPITDAKDKPRPKMRSHKSRA